MVADDKSGRWRRAEWVSYQQGPLARYKCWGEARAAVLRHVGPARARPVTDSCASRRRALSWRPSRLPRRPAVATLRALTRTQREDRSTWGQRWWVEYIITSFKVPLTCTINLIKTSIKTKYFFIQHNFGFILTLHKTHPWIKFKCNFQNFQYTNRSSKSWKVFGFDFIKLFFWATPKKNYNVWRQGFVELNSNFLILM